MKQNIPNLKKDVLISECEKLMLRGENPTDISRTLNISFNTAKNYYFIVQQRWANSADYSELENTRQDLIRQTKEIIKESWKLRKEAKNGLEATGALRTALQGIERLQKLTGIDMPLPPEEPKELQISRMADEVNKLPTKARELILTAIRKALVMTEGEKFTKDVRFQ